MAVAEIERRRLTAEAGPALVDVADVAILRQPVRADEAGDARPDDRDPGHARTAARMRAIPPKREPSAISPISVIGTATTNRSSSR